MICPRPVPETVVVSFLNICLLAVTEESKQISLICHRSPSFVRELAPPWTTVVKQGWVRVCEKLAAESREPWLYRPPWEMFGEERCQGIGVKGKALENSNGRWRCEIFQNNHSSLRSLKWTKSAGMIGCMAESRERRCLIWRRCLTFSPHSVLLYLTVGCLHFLPGTASSFGPWLCSPSPGISPSPGDVA